MSFTEIGREKARAKIIESNNGWPELDKRKYAFKKRIGLRRFDDNGMDLTWWFDKRRAA
tara:strand:- start:525 stop:701 length:177 start_codon:yes stop_codon:yes gene_type:complete